MPYRPTPLVTGEIYHVFNRSVAKQPIFITNRDYQRAMETINFYRFGSLPLSFSHYERLATEIKTMVLESMQTPDKKQISILAYCLMANHFHFQLEQLIAGGIHNFLRNIQNSYAKYFNTKRDRSGALFQSMFKAVRIESDEQLVHVNRYIHLNPLTSYIIKDPKELEKYPWCSFKDYFGNDINSIVDKEKVLGYFKSPADFKKFTFDQVDYQRELDNIKHLTLE